MDAKRRKCFGKMNVDSYVHMQLDEDKELTTGFGVVEGP